MRRDMLVSGLLMLLLSSSWAQRFIEAPGLSGLLYGPGLSPNGKVLADPNSLWTERDGLMYLRPDGTLTRNWNEAMHGYINDISYDGSMVVGRNYARPPGSQAFLCRVGVSVEYLQPPPGDWAGTTAWCMSWDGRVIYGAGVYRYGGGRVWRWIDGVVHDVGIPINPRECSADGSCAIGYPPLRWCADRGLSQPGGYAISGDGRVLAGNGWIWVEGRGYITIVPDPYRQYGASVYALSYDGRVAGGIYFEYEWDVNGRAFIWREGRGFEDLTRKYAWLIGEDVLLERVVSVSADGRYVAGPASRRNPSGGRRGFTFILDTRVTGDVDGDECVDDRDLLRVLFAFGQVGSGLPEDVDEDGMVWDSDVWLVLQHFGRGCR